MPSVVSEAAAVQPRVMKIFIDPVTQPTQKGSERIRFDFNNGCRVELPLLSDEKWRLRFSDTDTGNTVFDVESQGGTFQSTKVYYVPFKIEVWRNDRLVFVHVYSARGKNIQIQIPVGTLGDAIAWFPYADLFQKKHDCKLTCVVSEPVMARSEERRVGKECLSPV